MIGRGLGAIVLVLGALLACSRGNGGGDSGPRLVILEGPRVIGPSGQMTLSAYGSGTGPVSWVLVPSGLGVFVPEASSPIREPTSPSVTYGVRGTFTAGPAVGSTEFQVAAGEGTHRLQASTVIRVVQGIVVSPSSQEVQATPHLQLRLTVAVTAPGFPGSRVPPGFAGGQGGVFANGRSRASEPGGLTSNAPARAGNYVLKGVAMADPAASAQVRVVVP